MSARSSIVPDWSDCAIVSWAAPGQVTLERAGQWLCAPCSAVGDRHRASRKGMVCAHCLGCNVLGRLPSRREGGAKHCASTGRGDTILRQDLSLAFGYCMKGVSDAIISGPLRIISAWAFAVEWACSLHVTCGFDYRTGIVSLLSLALPLHLICGMILAACCDALRLLESPRRVPSAGRAPR